MSPNVKLTTEMVKGLPICEYTPGVELIAK